MASWCAICSRKLNTAYVWYRGRKAHKSCRTMDECQREIERPRSSG